VEVGEYTDSCEDLDDEDEDDEVKWRERERSAQEISWEGWDSLF
jgi:hypothetical protein